ncbi:MAG: MFS transporter [Rhodospirillales bacterium]|nr:MFS transporter [Rhodospirillales bacterium]
MWETIRSIASLLLSYGLLLLANGLFGTLLGLRSKLEGFSTETTGFIMAGYFVGLLLGALYAVRVVAAVGHIRAFAAFASIMSVAVLAHLLRIDPVTWLILRIVAGFCMAGMVMVTESWIHERSTNKTRGRVLSLYMMTNYLGAGLGQFLLTVAHPAEFQLFVISSIIFSLALVPILLTSASSPKPVSPQRMRFRDLFAISPVGVTGTIAAGLMNSSLNSMGPIYAAENGLSITQISTFMASTILGGMVLQFPIGRLSDRLDRRTIMIFTALAAIACALGIVWATPGGSWPMFLLTALYGGFAFTVYPLSAAQVNDLADVNQRVQIAAGLLIAYGIGAIAGPIVASQIMGQMGPQGLFIFISAIASGLVLITIVRMAMRPRGGARKAPYLPLGSIGFSGKQLYTAALKSLQRKKGK